MIPRWLIALPRGEWLPYYYAGKFAWTGLINSAVKFTSKESAESHAIIVATEEPHLMGDLSVVSYGEANMTELENRDAGKIERGVHPNESFRPGS